MSDPAPSEMLFLDTGNLAAGTEARAHLDQFLSYRYMQSFDQALSHLSNNRPIFVLLSCRQVDDALFEQCSLIENANPAGSTYIVLLAPETVAAQSNLALPGVVGFATLHTDWAVTVKQLFFIAGIASRLQRLESHGRTLRAATETFGIMRCTIDIETAACRAEPSLINAFGLSQAVAGSRTFHWKRLLERFSPADQQQLEESVQHSMHRRTDWSTTCRAVDELSWYECRGFFVEQVNDTPAHVELLFRKSEDHVLHAPGLLPQDDSVDALTQRIHSHAIGSILLIRIENYGSLRDALGHETSSQLLTSTLSNIAASVRNSDAVALAQQRDTNIVHIGGEEILVILDGISQGSLLERIQTRIQHALRQPITCDDKSIPLRTSVGRATWPNDGYSASDLLQQAAFSIRSTAQHQEQSSASLDAARQAVRLEADLYDALGQGELELHFQPKFRLDDESAVVGAEALLRWHRNAQEWVPPDVFIPIAESNGLILSMGRWVIEEAVRCQVQWLQAGLGLLPVSVNVSAEQFLQPDFLEHLEKTCESAGIPSNALEIEITESCLIEQPDRVIDILKQVKSKGFGIALDDFGTGFSSLSYLRTLPIDTLKIDRSFVQSLDGDEFDPALTAGIIGIGLALGLRIVAEGIETASQWQLLSEWGCHHGQGFLMSRPLSFAALLDLMAGQAEQRA